MAIITVENLKKSYAKVEAVKGIDFYVEEGKLFSFLGPNGAGKSTTIDILCTLQKQDSGRVEIDNYTLGKQDNAIRNTIGIVFQDNLLDPLLTVEENLTIRAKFYKLHGQKAKEAVLKAAQIADTTEFFKRPYGKLSGGQRRRADIARALVHTPKILFLDEPTTGLDPKTRESVWNTVMGLQKETGMTVFLTTHYMEEAAMSDYIILIDKGQIAAKGTPIGLKQKYSTDTVRLKPKDRAKVLQAAENTGFAFSEEQGIVKLEIPNTKAVIPLLNELAPAIDSFEVLHGSMDDVFLNITGRALQNV